MYPALTIRIPTLVQTVYKTRFPKWNHTWEFSTTDPIQEGDVVNITVYAFDKFSKNDFMGQVGCSSKV